MSFQNFKFMCGVKCGGYIFASCAQFNGLVKIDIETGETMFLGEFPGSPINCEYMHKHAYLIDTDIYFIPYKAVNVCKYNIEKETFHEIYIERGGYDGGYIAEQINDKIYMIPEEAGGSILEIDTNGDKVTCVITRQKLLEETESTKQDMLFFRICAMDRYLILPIKKTNKVLEVDVLKKQLKVHQLTFGKVFGCFEGKKKVWFLSEDEKKIYYWDMFTKAVKKLNFCPDYKGQKRYISWIVEMGKNVYIVPAWGTRIYKLENNQFVEMKSFQADNIDIQKFYTPIEDGGTLYLLPLGICDMLLIQDNQIKRVSIKPMSEKMDIYDKIIRAYVDNSSNRVLEEGIELDLEQYISALI